VRLAGRRPSVAHLTDLQRGLHVREVGNIAHKLATVCRHDALQTIHGFNGEGADYRVGSWSPGAPPPRPSSMCVAVNPDVESRSRASGICLVK
jgi:hypothetical protein